MKKSKKVGFIVLAIIAVLLLVLFLLGIYAEKQIKKTIDEELGDILKYENLDVSILNRKIELQQPKLTYSGNNVVMKELSVDGINYYQYLVNKKIRIGTIEIVDPEVVLTKNEEESGEKESGEKDEFKQDILVESVEIKNGTVKRKQEDTSKNGMFLALENFRIQEVAINAESVEQKIPFEYTDYFFEVDSLHMEMDDQHNFSIGQFSGDNGNFSINNFRILPKYDKVEFQRHIPYEKDRFELLVENISLDISWQFKNDSLLLRSDSLIIDGADFEIYRNKLVRDDPRQKELYSSMVRNLPAKIDFQKIELKDSRIVYQEKIKEDRPPGEVQFHDLDAEIQDLTNIGMSEDDFPKTVISANALFHNEAPVEVDWEFDISNETDAFTISGSLGEVSDGAINSFLRPAMNVEARGGIESLYFTYSGDDDSAQGDVQITYRDFKVNVLKDDGREKSSFWSAVANLFISNNAVNEDIENNDLEVTRDKNKSFWNYLWLMVREGALASFI